MKTLTAHRLTALVALLLAPSVALAVQTAGEQLVDLTPNSFSVVWRTSEPVDTAIRVFADAAATHEITDELEIIWTPLRAGDPVLLVDHEQQEDLQALRQAVEDRGLVQVQVAGLEAGTSYYYRLYSEDGVADVVWPSTGTASVATRGLSAFVEHPVLVVVNVLGDDPSGAIVTITEDSLSFGAAGVVGDGGGPGQAIVNLANMAGAGTAMGLPGTQATLHLSVAGGWDEPVTKDATVVVGAGFAVAQIVELNINLDGNSCTPRQCVAEIIPLPDDECTLVYEAAGTACDDGRLDTKSDRCDGNGGCDGVPFTCPTGACIQSSVPNGVDCDTVLVEDDEPCTDEDACTDGDTCEAGVCVTHPLDCDDDNPCTDDSCDSESGCVYEDNTKICTDGDACTVGDTCVEGACVGEARSCDDGKGCTTDSCDSELGCVNEFFIGACDDGNPCTANDACVSESCVGQQVGAAFCNDDDPCTDEACDPEYGCVYHLRPECEVGPPDVAHSRLLVPGSVAADGHARAMVIARVRDAQDRPVHRHLVTFRVSGDARYAHLDTNADENTHLVWTDRHGQAVAFLRSSVTDTVTVTAEFVGNAGEMSAQVGFVAGGSGKTRVISTPGGDVAISVSGDGADFIDVHNYSGDNAPEGLSVGTTLPYGLMALTIAVRPSGDGRATVTYSWPDPIKPPTRLWMFGPEPDDPTAHWWEITESQNVGGLADQDNSYVVVLQDGGFGDADGVKNGVIVDPHGPAHNPADIPTLGEWAVILLMLGLIVIAYRKLQVPGAA